MLQDMRQKGAVVAPLLAIGLFIGRILSELQVHQGWVLPVIITAVCTLLIGWFFIKWHIKPGWPAILLLFYVFYPEPTPQIASQTALFVLLLLLSMSSVYKVLGTGYWVLGIGYCSLFAFFLLLYLFTLSPGVLPADNGELQVVAHQLGVAHPPGFPLYTLLAHGMTLLPWSTAYEVNLFSAVTSTITLLVVYQWVYQLTKGHWGALTAVLALGSSTTFWAQATTANIRSLTGLFAALAFYILLCYWQPNTSNRPKLLSWFALVLSLGLTHHASLVFMAVVWGVFVFIVEWKWVKEARHWIRPFLAGLIGLLPLLYLPWRAPADVRGSSSDLATWNGFLDHVLARGFRGDFFYFVEPAVLWQRLKIMGNVMTFQFAPWLLVGMAVGIVLLTWRNRKLALLLGGSFAIHTFITATYRAPQTVEYMLPAYIPAVLCLGYAVEQVFRSHRVVGAIFAAGMLVTAVIQTLHHYPSYAALHHDTSTHTYIQLLLEQAPPDAVILADWHWATPLWYLQEVEGLRPDVTVRFVFPEGEPYAQTWARRIGEELENGRFVIATHFDEETYAQLPPAEPISDAFLFRPQPRTNLPSEFTALEQDLSDTIHVVGYQIQPTAIEIGQEAIFTLAWQPIPSLQSPISLFAHLVGSDGLIYAQQDLTVLSQPADITLTQFRLTPRLGAMPGEFAIFIGVAGSEGRTQFTTLTVTAMRSHPTTQHPVYRTIAKERPFLRLVGYDWDTTLPGQTRLYLHWQTEQGYQTEVRDNITAEILNLPPSVGPWGVISEQWTVNSGQLGEHYVPFGQGIVWLGDTFSPPSSLLTPRSPFLSSHQFTTSRPLTRDLVISVRLIGYETDNFQWDWWDLEDSVPAMGAIPTLKWITGSRVWSPHNLVVSEAAYAGQTMGATLRLYDAFTNRPLPILDERITNQFPWVPLGMATSEP